MIAIVYNLPAIGGRLKLSRSTLVDLMNGRIPKWDDARISSVNPDLKFRPRDVVLAVRLDSSGTTYALTNHLSAISERWRRANGAPSNTVDWQGAAMRARGNEGVAALIKRNPWTIGYVEYGYAKRLGLEVALIENKAGEFVEPSAESGAAAITANLKAVPANLRAFLPDPEGEASYPIVSLTWLLLREQYPDPAKADALKRFVDWALTSGQPYGVELGFVPLPEGLVERARASARAIK
jgi:phosphate transport system substrate-binding protein